ncbi:MAG: DUF3795 domain-containing protein [Anaeroplasma sp.]
MNDIFIAYCGLNCQKCEARLATINDNDDLRTKVAEEWSILNGIEITKEMVNCEGCKTNGLKTLFCEKLCPIRLCASKKNINNCGKCEELNKCDKIKLIISNNDEALERLIK